MRNAASSPSVAQRLRGRQRSRRGALSARKPTFESKPAVRLLANGTRGARIGMAHVPGPAAGHEERLVRRFPGCDAVVYGHTHLPEVERHGGVWILNPGSPTERRRAPAHTMLVLEIEAGEIRPELVVVEG